MNTKPVSQHFSSNEAAITELDVSDVYITDSWETSGLILLMFSVGCCWARNEKAVSHETLTFSRNGNILIDTRFWLFLKVHLSVFNKWRLCPFGDSAFQQTLLGRRRCLHQEHFTDLSTVYSCNLIRKSAANCNFCFHFFGRKYWKIIVWNKITNGRLWFCLFLGGLQFCFGALWSLLT